MREVAGRYATFRWQLRAFESCDYGRIVVLDKEGSRTQVAVDDRLFIRAWVMKVSKGTKGIPRKGKPAGWCPCNVSVSVLKAGGCRVDDCEKEHFTGVSRGVAVGIQDPRRPRVK